MDRSIGTLQLFFLMVLTSWLSTTLAIDFMAVPTVFKGLPDVYLAGNVGIQLFSKYNLIEIIMGILCIGLGFLTLRSYEAKALMAVSIALLGLAIVYKFYLSPQIAHFAGLMEGATDKGSDIFVKAAEKHSFFHGLYIKLDSGKIALLIVNIVLIFRLKRQDAKIFS